MRKMIDVQHDDIAGIATVPESALPRMVSQGWSRVDEEEVAPAEGPDGGETPPSEVAVDLKGQELDAALEAAELPKTGTADEKRARLAEHQHNDE